ncbi:MAG: NAD-dependent epimerase/dehydratase family protein [Candidatus Paceibacterota bacterium]|jgi:nucleoside-diphosphate-sugar epimerase
MKIFITGAAGYVGKVFLKRMAGNNEVEKIFALDAAGQPEGFNDPKISWIKANLAKDKWEEKLPAGEDISAVFHFAFWIRNPYGKILETEKENLESCRRVFDFCFKKNIKKLIYISSVAAYGAKPENANKILTENDPLEEKKYPYGLQKKLVEEMLVKMIAEKKPLTQVFVLRPGSIWGPEGEKKKKFGLMVLLKKLLPVLPLVNDVWARQYAHEQDIVGAMSFLAFNRVESNFEIFNFAAPDIITTKDMARFLGKKTIKVPFFLIKTAFFFGWHLTRGIVPTPPGAEMSFTWPINVDGSKIIRFGFRYNYTSAGIFKGGFQKNNN